MKKVIFILLAIFALSAVFLVFRVKPSPLPSGRPVVAATIFPVYDLTRSVSKGRADVELILPPGASPHTFEPTPGLVKRLSVAKVVFKIGLVDDWADRIAPEGVIMKVDKGIEFKNFGITTFGEEEDEGDYDPHYWLIPGNARIMARNIYEALAATDPEGEPVYRENLAALDAELAALDAELERELTPFARSSIITFHDAWGYFADRYDLKIAAVFIPSPGKEITPGDIRAVGEAAKLSGSRAVFSEPQFPKDIVDSFASDFGLKAGILEAEGGVPGRDSYAGLMRLNVSNIIRALK